MFSCNVAVMVLILALISEQNQNCSLILPFSEDWIHQWNCLDLGSFHGDFLDLLIRFLYLLCFCSDFLSPYWVSSNSFVFEISLPILSRWSKFRLVLTSPRYTPHCACTFSLFLSVWIKVDQLCWTLQDTYFCFFSFVLFAFFIFGKLIENTLILYLVYF